MSPSFHFACATLLVPVLTTACRPVVIAPPPLPPATIPSLPGDAHADATTPAAGFAQVRLTTDVPARAYLHADAVGGTGRQGPRSIETLVCEKTPCAFVVAYGDHELDVEGTESATVNELGEHQSYSNRTATVIVHAHAPEVVLNQTLGSASSPPARALAGGLMVLGAALVIGAGGVARSEPQSGGTVGGLLIAGASSLALGGIILAAVPSIEQPAATREWVPKQAATAGGSVGFRF